MLFSSISFLYWFLPIFLFLYLCLPFKYKNLTLLLGSLLFYFMGEPTYILILIFSSLVDYIHGLILEVHRSKLVLMSSIVINIGLLSVFKYSGFFIDNVNSLLDTNFINPGLALPLGISFYTFQTMSYTIDVYRGNIKAHRNFIDFAAYVCMFPQLVAGPIVRYSSINAQLTQRTHNFDSFAIGVSRFTFGLAKKVLIANNIGQLSQTAYSLCSDGNGSVVLYWIGAASFALQIYFDFSGYSDMAIGLGKMLGFDFPENFNYPFTSKSVTDFWRRWHMTLGGWFKDYVYFPLGGNRVSKGKWIRNLVIVWSLTGLWHGASWNFVFWGLYFALFLSLEKLFFGKWLENSPTFLQHIYTVLVVVISFVIFNTENMPLLFERLGRMIGFGGIPLVEESALYYLRSYGMLLVVSAIAATPLSLRFVGHMKKKPTGGKIISVLEPILLLALLILSTAYIVDSSFNPFLYFRF